MSSIPGQPPLARRLLVAVTRAHGVSRCTVLNIHDPSTHTTSHMLTRTCSHVHAHTYMLTCTCSVRAHPSAHVLTPLRVPLTHACSHVHAHVYMYMLPRTYGFLHVSRQPYLIRQSSTQMFPDGSNHPGTGEEASGSIYAYGCLLIYGCLIWQLTNTTGKRLPDAS